jgi:indolepyruvate ferredoxin oxidoreductase beta subunit
MTDIDIAPSEVAETVTSVLLCGVGGQGTILAGDLLAKTAAASGCDVSLSGLHGMSQRGGSVDTLIRFGRQVHSPLICRGEADFVVAFETLEAARWATYLRPGGTLVMSRTRIAPLPVLLGKSEYPETVERELAAQCRLIAADAVEEAVRAGSARAANLFLLGVLSGLLPFDEQTWREVIEARVPAKTIEVNLRAFERGRAMAGEGR